MRNLTQTLLNRSPRRASLVLAAVACAALLTLTQRPSGAFAARLAVLPPNCAAVYTVQSGDVLWQIAAAHGTTAPALGRLNQIDNIDAIWPGERICVAVAGSGATAPPVAPPTQPQPQPQPVASGAVPWQGGSPNWYPYGWCTYGAAALAYDNVEGLGDAWHWIYGARARGMPTGTVPRVGATVVFQPGVDGASPLGHVAHVTAVYADGSFDARSMAQPTWGVFTTWRHWMKPGIAFIY